jgi:hypothetical protein
VRYGRLYSVEQKTALTAAEMCADSNNEVATGKPEAACGKSPSHKRRGGSFSAVFK